MISNSEDSHQRLVHLSWAVSHPWKQRLVRTSILGSFTPLESGAAASLESCGCLAEYINFLICREHSKKLFSMLVRDGCSSSLASCGSREKIIVKITMLLFDIINLFLKLMEETNIISFFKTYFCAHGRQIGSASRLISEKLPCNLWN